MNQYKIWIKIVSIFLTVVLITETAGVNIVSYCCGNSIVSVFPMQEDDSCGSHCSEVQLPCNSCADCKGVHFHQEHCSTDCKDLKWVHQSFENTISRSYSMLPLFFLDQIIISLFSFVPNTITIRSFVKPDLPVKTSRHYLSMIQVFLI